MGKYGRLTIIRPLDVADDKKRRFLCRCECGIQTVVLAENLLSGHTKSCGCLKREIIGAGAHTTHGLSKTRIYRIWKGMRKRCRNPNDSNYPKYGGRGIRVCPEWDSDFLSFYFWAMESGYNDSLSIDRIDNNKGYSPDNCQWSNETKQANNRRSNRLATIDGETHSIIEWSKIYKISTVTIYKRIRQGMSETEAITTPRGVNQWSKTK